MSLPVALSWRSGKGAPSHTPAIPKILKDVKFIAVKWSQNEVDLEIFHKRNLYLTQLAEIFWKKWLAYMVLKETNCNNYIVLIEKYLETMRFDWLIVETSKILLCYKIQWVQPKTTSYNTCLHLRCPISVTNGMISTPHGPLILIKLMSFCNLTPLISVCWQQLPDVMLWSLTRIFSLYQIWYAKMFSTVYVLTITKLSCRHIWKPLCLSFCTGLLTANVKIFV